MTLLTKDTAKALRHKHTLAKKGFYVEVWNQKKEKMITYRVCKTRHIKQHLGNVIKDSIDGSKVELNKCFKADNKGFSTDGSLDIFNIKDFILIPRNKLKEEFGEELL